MEDTEDYINIMLDDKQNQLLQMGVVLSTATLMASCAVVVTAVVAAVDAVLGTSPRSSLLLGAAGLLVLVAVLASVRLLAPARRDVGGDA